MSKEPDDAENLNNAKELMPVFNDKHTNQKLKDEQQRMRNLSKSPKMKMKPEQTPEKGTTSNYQGSALK